MMDDEILHLLSLEAFADAAAPDRRTAVLDTLRSLLQTSADCGAFLKRCDFADLSAAAVAVGQLRAEQAVTEAVRAGKLPVGQRAWALNFAAGQPQAFAEWCAAAPRQIPDNAIPEWASDPVTPESKFTPDQLAVFRMLGIAEADAATLQ